MKIELPNLKLLARNSELASKVSFSQDQVANILGRLRETFADKLPNFDKQQEEKYILRNDETETANQISIVLDKDKIQLVWAQGTEDNNAINMIERICHIAEEKIPALSKLLAHIDTEYVFDFETDIYHYNLIQDVYYSNSPFAKICKKERINFTNDINYRLLLEDKRILIIRVIGSHRESDIEKGKQDQGTLRLRISVGQIHNLDSPLDKTFEKHFSAVDELLQNELLENIIKPLAQKISEK